MHRILRIFLPLWVVLLSASQCWASPSEDAKNQAEKLFQEGKQALEQGLYTEACNKFQQSQQLDPAGGTILALAFCLEQTGQRKPAMERFQEALVWAKKSRNTLRSEIAERHIEALRALLSGLDFHPLLSYSELRIEIDHQVFPHKKWSSVVFLNPGNHTIEFFRGTQLVKQIQWQLFEGDLLAVSPAFLPVSMQREDKISKPNQPAMVAPTVPHKESQQPPWVKPVSLSLAVPGALLFGVGSHLGIKTLNDTKEIRMRCPQNPCEDQTALSLRSGLGSRADFSTLFLATGTLLIGTAISLFLFVPAQPTTQHSSLQFSTWGLSWNGIW
jgi:hypothetical protein